MPRQFTKASLVTSGNNTRLLLRFSTVARELRTTDTASDPPGFVHPSGHSSHPFMWSNAGGQRFQVKYHV